MIFRRVIDWFIAFQVNWDPGHCSTVLIFPSCFYCVRSTQLYITIRGHSLPFYCSRVQKPQALPTPPQVPRQGTTFLVRFHTKVKTHVIIASSCEALPSSSLGFKCCLAGPMMQMPSLLNRLPCTGQSQLFSSLFQQTTPCKCGHNAEN